MVCRQVVLVAAQSEQRRARSGPTGLRAPWLLQFRESSTAILGSQAHSLHTAQTIGIPKFAV